MTEQYHYDSGFRGPNVFGIAFRGDVRRAEFLARLSANGRLRLACIDRTAAQCAAHASFVMATPAFAFSEVAPAETLPDGHHLSFIEIFPPTTQKQS